MSATKCYVTGKSDALGAYFFGSESHVRLALTQEAFAIFVLRAGKDTMHQQIMADIKRAADELDELAAASNATPANTDERIDASITFAIKADKFQNLITQKAESGVRILRQMKKDYEQTGKLLP